MKVKYTKQSNANKFLIEHILTVFKDILGEEIIVNKAEELINGETLVNITNSSKQSFHLIIDKLRIGDGLKGRSVKVKIIDDYNKVLEFYYVFPFIYTSDACYKEGEYTINDTVSFLINRDDEYPFKYILKTNGYQIIMNFDDIKILNKLLMFENNKEKQKVLAK